MTKRNGLVVALLVSAALNLLIAGAVIGRWSRNPPLQPPPPFTWTARNLTPEVQQQVRQRLQDRVAEVRPLRAEMREVAQAVRGSATAEPFDPAALKRALSEMRGVQQRYQAVMHNSVVDIAAGLPREQRLALLRQALDRENGRDRHRPGPSKGPRESR